MRLRGHGPCRLRPARARTSRRLDDKASRLGEQLNLVGQLRLIQENLWDADASRVASMRVLIVMCLQCRHAGLDPQAAVQQANAAYEPPAKPVGSMGWLAPAENAG
jgi:hypothetical protein